MEIPRLRVKSELQLLAYTTDTAIQDPRHVCDLHYSSQQHWILNPLSRNSQIPFFESITKLRSQVNQVASNSRMVEAQPLHSKDRLGMWTVSPVAGHGREKDYYIRDERE